MRRTAAEHSGRTPYPHFWIRRISCRHIRQSTGTRWLTLSREARRHSADCPPPADRGELPRPEPAEGRGRRCIAGRRLLEFQPAGCPWGTRGDRHEVHAACPFLPGTGCGGGPIPAAVCASRTGPPARKREGRAGRRAARRDGHGDVAGADRPAHRAHRAGRAVPPDQSAVRPVRAEVRAAGIPALHPPEHRADAGIDADGRCDAGAGLAG